MLVRKSSEIRHCRLMLIGNREAQPGKAHFAVALRFEIKQGGKRGQLCASFAAVADG